MDLQSLGGMRGCEHYDYIVSHSTKQPRLKT